MIRAPIDEVFARLADINGHNDWVPQKGSILRHTQPTSPGAPGLGTTFLDTTTHGPTTLVRHHARMHTYGSYRLATPIFRRIAIKERTTTVDALKTSLETST